MWSGRWVGDRRSHAAASHRKTGPRNTFLTLRRRLRQNTVSVVQGWGEMPICIASADYFPCQVATRLKANCIDPAR
jgi:hypothetical protein